MQWFNKRESQAWTAIRTTSDKTYIAQVTKRVDAKPLVNFIQIEPSNILTPRQGPASKQSALKALVQKYKLKTARCSFVLDASDYQLMQVDKPNVPDNEQTQAIRWKLKDMIDYPVEQATIDVIDIPGDPNYAGRQPYVYAFAAKNKTIADLSNLLLQAGVNLQAIDAKVMAQRNIASLLEQADRGLAMISFNHSGGLLTFTAGGELFHARRIDIEEERTESAFEKISLELQRSLDNFERTFPFIAINKLVVAPFAEREEFCEHLRNYFYLPVEHFDLTDVFEFKNAESLADLGLQASLLPVLGAALREEVAA